MTEHEQELNALDRDAKAAKPVFDLGSALTNLRSNRDFKKLIVEGYLKDEAVRLVSLKADPHMQEPAQQAAIIKQIDAIGNFGQYLNTVESQARIAGNQLHQIDLMREELLTEMN